MESDEESEKGDFLGNMKMLMDYFGVFSEIQEWSEREKRSMDEIVDEILDWEPSKEIMNIFLVNSYHEDKRGRASFYIASKLADSGAHPMLINSPDDLRKARKKSAYDEKDGKTVYFLNYVEGSSISSRNLQKIIISLGRRGVGKIPVVVSVPNPIMGLFERRVEEEQDYPQNTISRALLFAGMALLLTPLVDFPYTQIPFGNNTGLSDAGLIILVLFLYSIVLMVLGRKSLAKKESVPMAASVFIVILSFFSFAITSPLLKAVGGTPLNSMGLGGIFILLLPVFIRLAAFSIFPMGFAVDIGKRHLLFLFILSSAIVLASAFLLSYTVLGSLVNPHLAAFKRELLFITFFPPMAGNKFMTGVFAIPVSLLYFLSYNAISNEMRSKFRNLAASVRNETGRKRHGGKESGASDSKE